MDRRLLLATLALPLLAACAAQTYPQATYLPIGTDSYEGIESWPAANAESSVEIGSTLAKTFSVVKLPGVELKTPFRTTVPYRDKKPMGIHLAAGKLEFAGNDDSGGKYYRAAPGIFMSWTLAGEKTPDSQRTLVGGVHVSAQGKSSVWWLWSGTGPANFVEAPKLELQPTTVARPGEKPFLRELIYSGTSGTTMSLLYREFDKDLARPAFMQELKYDIGRSKTIGFKGARIEIVDAGNTSVRYRVLTPLQ